MKSNNTINFIYKSDWDDEEYAPRLTINVECDGDSTLNQVLIAFKAFLKAMEYSEELVEKIGYEDDNYNTF